MWASKQHALWNSSIKSSTHFLKNWKYHWVTKLVIQKWGVIY
jgi:hypothetical protein